MQAKMQVISIVLDARKAAPLLVRFLSPDGGYHVVKQGLSIRGSMLIYGGEEGATVNSCRFNSLSVTNDATSHARFGIKRML